MLDDYENFLSSEWFAGATLTYIDFVMYELLDWIRLFAPPTFAKMEKLTKFMEFEPHVDWSDGAENMCRASSTDQFEDYNLKLVTTHFKLWVN